MSSSWRTTTIEGCDRSVLRGSTHGPLARSTTPSASCGTSTEGPVAIGASTALLPVDDVPWIIEVAPVPGCAPEMVSVPVAVA